MQYLKIVFQGLATGYLIYRLKSMAGIDLAHHHHATDVFWHPVEVLKDIATSMFA